MADQETTKHFCHSVDNVQHCQRYIRINCILISDPVHVIAVEQIRRKTLKQRCVSVVEHMLILDLNHWVAHRVVIDHGNTTVRNIPAQHTDTLTERIVQLLFHIGQQTKLQHFVPDQDSSILWININMSRGNCLFLFRNRRIEHSQNFKESLIAICLNCFL